MTLKIWTAAEAGLIKKTFGETLKSMRPAIPMHEFIAWKSHDDPIPKIGVNDVLLASGSNPLETLRRKSLAPKNRTVTSLRENPLKIDEGWGLVTFDPGVLASDPSQREIMDWDLRLAVRLMQTGSLAPQVGEYRYVDSYQETIAWIEAEYARTGKAVPVSCDTETMTFHCWYPEREIVSISFTAKPQTADVLYLGETNPPKKLDPDIVPLFDQIEWLLNSPKVSLRFANGKYDLIWIKHKWGLACTNFKFDSMLVGSLLDENRSNSLNVHAKVFTDMGGYDDEFNKTQDKGHMELIDPQNEKIGYLTYAGGDTDAAQRVSEVLKEELLQDPELSQFYVTILHPAARAFENIETRGVHVSQERYAALRQDLNKAIDEGYGKALELLPMKIRHKFHDRIDEQLKDGKSPMLPSILKEFFFSPNGLNLKPIVVTEKTKEPSMAKSHLKMFDNPYAKEMVECLTTADVAAKTRSTFVDGFVNAIRPDGLLHPTYFLGHAEFDEAEGDEDSGTVTGRLSAKGPPIQIVPKKTSWAKRIRECFTAPLGKKLLQLDYSQGELRVVACVANEKAMLAAYEAGLDMHAVTGARLGQVTYEEFLAWKEKDDLIDYQGKQWKLSMLYDDLRTRAKAGNFGLLYGMGVDGFIAYAWANYGLKLSYEEGENIRNGFFKAYPGLLDYHDHQRSYVKLHEMVRSPLGRVRHLQTIRSWDKSIKSSAERQAINSPIQSTLSDMMLWAIGLIQAEYPNEEIPVVAMIHDAIYAYVDEDKVELRAAQAKEIMSNLPFDKVGWHPQLKFPADAEAGDDLAHLSKVKAVPVKMAA